MQANPELIKLIKMQRTGHKDVTSWDDIMAAYEKNIVRDFETIEEFLPMNPSPSILDIGAGLGGIDIYLYDHYKSDARLFLLDKEGYSYKVFYGFYPNASKYNSFDMTRRFLADNGIKLEDIRCVDAERNEHLNLFQHRFDVIISLLSCGFHYPVETYLPLIKMTLNRDGVCILDIRSGMGQQEVLKQSFAHVEIIKTIKQVERTLVKWR
jgi:SAM-dependent methyltransferase